MRREEISSGTVWESDVGYSRAVRVGREVHVSGTTATDDSGEIVGIGDPEAQARQAFENVEWALRHSVYSRQLPVIAGPVLAITGKQ